MNIEVAKISVTGGEFRILAPDDAGLQPPEQQEGPTLIVGCRYALTDNSGASIAEGNASNSPVASGSSITLSDVTLAAFDKFFSSLEHDIANALESKSNGGKGKQALEDLLAGKLPG